MKLTAESIAEIIRHPETVHVECKSTAVGLPNTMWETYSSFLLWDRLKLRRPQIVEFYDPDRVSVKLSFSQGDGAELPQNCPKTVPRAACRYACSLV